MTPNPSSINLGRPLNMSQPLDIDDAREASRRMSELYSTAVDEYERLSEDFARKEKTYRIDYSTELTRAEGSVTDREALAKAKVAEQKFERDLAERMLKVQEQRLEQLRGTRSMLNQLISWSARVDPNASRIEGREPVAA